MSNKMPQLPLQALNDLQAARKVGQKVFQREFSAQNSHCTNCNGQGVIWLQFVQVGPLDRAPIGRGVAIVVDGLWYLVESRLYPCPVCNDPALRGQVLGNESGLEPDERGWRLDYLEGKGKGLALGEARALESCLPRPTGWFTFYGGYGMGKSGILKCLVAACIRQGIPARYVRAEDILNEMRATFGENCGPSADELAAAYGHYQLLAVDEIDRTSATGWARATMLTILDTRYNRRTDQATLLATNQDPQNLAEGLEYLSSRMLDGVRVRVDGAPLRG